VKKPILVVFIILFLDQVLKIWVKTNMALGDSIPMLGDWFYIHFVENKGMAFGWQLFGGGGFGKVFLSLFRIVAIGAISYYLYLIVKQKKHPVFIYSIAMVLAGAAGNIFDSLFYGMIFEASGPFTIAAMFPESGGYASFLHGNVVDMFYFPLFSGIYPEWIPWVGGDYYQFFQPVFNIADASISVGVAVLVLGQKKFFEEEKAKDETPISKNENNNTEGITKLTLGFSSCPNDTFIFDAMIHGKIDTEGLEFDLIIEDVEELNRRAFNGELDITKISFNAYTHLLDKYILLDSGAALGENCGPLIISKSNVTMDDIKDKVIAIPGKNTTANLLMTLAFPEHKNKKEMLFSDIQQAIIDGKVDAGLIIHESRFTYEGIGLKKVLDIGEYWENTTGTPTPLGGIIIKRDLSDDLTHKVNRVLKRSVEFAMQNPKSGIDFIRKHSQEMSEEVMYKHIALYVNDYSVDLGDRGKEAIQRLFLESNKAGLIEEPDKKLFL